MKIASVVVTLVVGLVGVPAARADHPQSRQMRDVERIATDLEHAAHEAYDEAKHSGHHGTRDRIHDLHDTARHFRDQVRRSYADPDHTEADFRHLVSVYYSASDAADDSGHRSILRDVDAHMRQLMDFYGGADAWSQDRGHGHDRDRHH